MACNSCNNHGGGMFEDLFRHTSTGTPNMPNPVTNKPLSFLVIGGLVLGAVILTKWSKT
jgi:hypothetical protein